jgi:mannose-6-phosphate isomerase-like protein (cupin superfamily)
MRSIARCAAPACYIVFMPARREIFTIAGAAALGLAARLQAVDGAKLPNGTLDVPQAKVMHEPFGDLAIYFNGSTDQIGSMTAGSLRLKPGRSPHPPHQHPEEEFMVITEGTGDILVDGKTTKVRPGSMMYCAAGKVHGIFNTGTEPLLFYFYKWKV